MNNEPNDIRRRIVALRESLGLNQTEFSLKIEVSQPTVSRWESGKDTPDYWSLRTLAALAGCRSVDEFLGFPVVVSGVNLQPVQVIGVVEAGAWREALEWPPDRRFFIQVPEDPRFVGLTLQAFQVNGPSMDRFYPPGSFVIAVSFIALGRDPIPGEHVICQRRNNLGEIEATIKEYVVLEGMPYLWPRSHHPDFQTPSPVAETPGIEDFQITALICGTYKRV